MNSAVLQQGEDFDPHFKVFYELMPFKVREILLVSSPYDAYILEEDGSLASRIINEYHGLNLSKPPRITRVADAGQALRLLAKQEFDMVVTMPHLGGMDGCALGGHIKKRHGDIPVILLAHSVADAIPGRKAPVNFPVDNAYVWCCDSNLLLALVKNTEDRVNVDSDTLKAMVRVIILVEDSPLYRSTLLPILYHEVVVQTQSVLDEGLNEQHRLLKMRARPKILTASTYEEAILLFEKYRPYVFCVMSDVRFPKDGKISDEAGFELVQKLRREVPDLPLLILSSEPKNRKRALEVPVVFVEKNSRTLHEEIHSFFLNHLGFGDFVFRTPDGREVARACDLHDFEQRLKTIPSESLWYHAINNHFSNWVMARAEIALAARLQKKQFTVTESSDALRQDIIFKVHALRRLRQQGIVAQFSGRHFDPAITDFVRIGQGSMGGKARGIAFFRSWLQRSMNAGSALVRGNVTIPQTCVITSDGFDDFVEQNRLHLLPEESDASIAHRFLAATTPDWLLADLRAFLKTIDYPLSIRSSSLLEDAQFRPYAGLYNTFMLTNRHPDFEVRLEQLVRAVKLVYASTWFEGPRAFSRSIGQIREESMAVIIQQLAGSRHGNYFYPALSGVTQSFNYYPVGPMRAEDGIAHIALGFGKTVVEGERSLRFSPAFPNNLPQFSTVDDILNNAQRWFYSLSWEQWDGFSRADSNLVRRELMEAADDAPVRRFCSTYFPEEHRIRDSDQPGYKLLTFAPLLKHGLYPLPEVLTELLDCGRKGMGCEVEIEFSLDLADDPTQSVFYFLQVRPIVTGSESRAVAIVERERKAAFLHSNEALGHGLFTTMRDIVYVIPENFTFDATRKIAREVGLINRTLHKGKNPYLLIGPGRWGSADPWLGIPVLWSDISGVGAIIELQGFGVDVEPSQGSHFFQNITSLGIPYLMVKKESKEDRKQKKDGQPLDFSLFEKLELVRQTRYIRHVRFQEPFVLKVDGHSSEAVAYEQSTK